MHNIVNTQPNQLIFFQMIEVWTAKISRFCQQRWIPWVLFMLALLRNVILLFAYPPAHGSDSLVYFVYAERFLGFNAPAIADLAPPLYPVFILLASKVLGSIYWLIGLQFVLSALLPPLGYFIGKRYQPIFGLLIGLIVLGDVQIAALYNFTSTEPLYIFLLMLMYWLYLRTADLAAEAKQERSAFLVGVLLQLTMLTRAVARYLILPLVIIFAIMTRRYRLAGYLVAGFVASTVVYILFTVLVFGRVEGFTTSNLNMLTIFLVKPEWIQPENGSNSEIYLNNIANCEHPGYFGKLYCLRTNLDGWDHTQAVLGGTYSEMVRRHPTEYVGAIWQQINDFLALSGQQLGWDPQTPSAVQCASAENNRLEALEDFTWTHWPAILPDFAPETLEAAGKIRADIAYTFCPPLVQGDDRAKQFVDAVAVRYRSLGRPQPLLWYGALFFLVLILPSAKHYRTLVLSGLAILFNHAFVSSLVLSVQPRYAAVVNPIRAILLVALLFIVVEIVFRLLRRDFVRRTAKTSIETHNV